MLVLKQAYDRGTGLIGMKIYGRGDILGENERQKSLAYVWGSGNRVDKFLTPYFINTIFFTS
jgi:hypothetical protein